MVRPVTVIEPLPDWVTVAVTEPGVEVAVYEVMIAPPFDVGAVNATEAEVALAIAATPIVGAPGATDATVNDTLTCGAARVVKLPAWFALMLHVPVDTNARTPPPLIVHTPVVDDVNATVSAAPVVAVSVGVVPKFFVPGFANVIDWTAIGVTDPDATDAADVPPLFEAVAVNEYAVPFVRSVTVHDPDDPVTVQVRAVPTAVTR